ncbi:hypothetical protein chiPu_0005573 [Chiloscyllium punctatum]|uniref:Uncharacterized protein n=1 Tax=Chiloscyllium punctatum TaxID=137246 RepID=A0A401S9R9_CHIPU|nr:hypothetical protein [Chiloscyllium punctatum]
MAAQATSQDIITSPDPRKEFRPTPLLNEALVKILSGNLLGHEKGKAARKSPSISPRLSPNISPRNSPRLLRRMMLNKHQKKRRFTVAHTW